MPLQDGRGQKPSAFWEFGHSGQKPLFSRYCPVSISPVVGQSARPLMQPRASALAAPDSCEISRAWQFAGVTSVELPTLTLDAVEDTRSGTAVITEEERIAGPAAAPAAEEVESPLPPFPEPQALRPDAAILAMPRLLLQPTRLEIILSPAGPVASPAAEAVERFLLPAAQAKPIEPSVAPPALPALALAPARMEIVPEMADAVPGLAAEAVEKLFPPVPRAPAIEYPAAALALPVLVLEPVQPESGTTSIDGAEDAPQTAAEVICGPAVGPAPQEVEAWLPAPPLPQALGHPVPTLRLPQLALKPAQAEIVAALFDTPKVKPQAAKGRLSGPVAAPAAQEVESLFPPAAEPQALPYPAAAASLPVLALEPAQLEIVPEVADAVAGPAAEVVERFVLPVARVESMAHSASALAMPALALEPAQLEIVPELADAVAGLAAEAAERFLLPVARTQLLALSASAVAMPLLALEPAQLEIVPELADAVAGPAPEAVESLFPAVPQAPALAYPAAALRLPELTVTAAELFAGDSVLLEPPSEAWMPAPPAEEVARSVWPSVAGVLPLPAATQAPSVAALAIAEPMVRDKAGLRPPLTAEPVVSTVWPLLGETLPGEAAEPAAISLPDITSIKPSQGDSGQKGPAPLCEEYPVAPTVPNESLPSLNPPDAFPAVAASGSRLIELPAITVEPAGTREAAFQPAAPYAAAPETVAPDARPAVLEPVRTASTVVPAAQSERPSTGLPTPGLVPMEFFCQPAPMAPQRRLNWVAPTPAVLPPKFGLRLIVERVEEALEPEKPARKTPAFAEIFTITQAAQRRARSSSGMSKAAKLIAASLLVGVGLWFGAGSAKMARQLVAIAHTSLSVSNSSEAPTTDRAPLPAGGSAVAAAQAPRASGGPIARIRSAIQNRAAVEMTDTFRGMQAFGATPKALPVGWARNKDGYVKTGQMALYHPSQTFQDYRLEFFGQIETKAIGWAVRAHDGQNYYGMKFKIVEPGLRPVIAVQHYPVVDGKKGQPVETPLGVMVHNDTPYHVAVDVRGNRVVTSIEGQEVDSWTDDTLKVGGVGFFSDVGESARLYWMRITKNQDWLGRVCAYLSGSSSTSTADLWREGPAAPQPPAPSAPPQRADVLLAATGTGEFEYADPQRARTLKDGRTRTCRS